MRPPTIAISILICAGLVQPAGASTIIQSSGNSEASVPLGYYAPYGTATVYAVCWTQSSAYSNVAVFANLFNAGGGGTVDYMLTTAIGESTSLAQDGIIRGSVTTPANPTDLELFTLPDLAAGTYYLVLASPTPGSAWQYNFPFLSNYTAAPGVSFLGDQESQSGSIDTAYTAGSTFAPISFPVEFSVTGTPSSVPEPGFIPPIGLLMIGLALHRVRTGKRAAAEKAGSFGAAACCPTVRERPGRTIVLRLHFQCKPPQCSQLLARGPPLPPLAFNSQKA
ncbi:MAG TPA: hypothetical protein VKB88_05290 [Bryobacteraceae bacterium]|nr:hypothetical protein [Bryobacteraceae bacterium]